MPTRQRNNRAPHCSSSRDPQGSHKTEISRTGVIEVSGPFERIGENELAFFFQTNEPIPARPLLDFLYEVERIALTQRHLGPSAIVEITEVRTGTKAARLTFNQKLGVGALAVAVAQLGMD